MPENPPALDCSLAPDDLADRGRSWLGLEPMLVDRLPVEGGFQARYRDEPGVGDRLRALATAEQGCCGWALWTVTAHDGLCTLTVTGPADKMGALASAFGV